MVAEPTSERVVIRRMLTPAQHFSDNTSKMAMMQSRTYFGGKI
jgi:hypothetical protein